MSGSATSTAQVTALRRIAWRGAFLWLFAAWVLAYAIVLSRLDAAPYDGDSLMRLQQVRDLLAGQPWFDVTQYRMNPPAGAAMHWSRLVDVPLAAAQLVLRPLLGPAGAEYAAGVLIPLAYVAAAMALLLVVMLRLGLTRWQALGGLAVAPLFPQLPAAFAPMQIDHHAPQALCALALATLLVHRARRRAAILAGVVGAGWMAISLEGLPMVVLAAALFGIDYVRRAERTLTWFLGSLALASAALSLATRPASEFALYCDILLPAHWAAFTLGAGLTALLQRLPGQSALRGRIAALALVAAVCGAFAYFALGECALAPMGRLDPMVRRFWFDTVSEGLPLWRQPWPASLIAAHAALLIPAGLWAARRRGLDRTLWLTLAGFAAGAALYGLFIARETMPAQLLALPFAAVLLAHLWPRARALASALARIAASLVVLLLATPAASALVAAQLSAPSPPSTPRAVAPVAARPLAPCDFHSLAALPPGLIATTYNAAPAVLVQSGHAVSVGGYHRNGAALHRSIASFTSPPDAARRLLASQGARYLAVCLDDASLAVMAGAGPDSLAAGLLAGRVPDWLMPPTGLPASRLLVFRVAGAGETSRGP